MRIGQIGDDRGIEPQKYELSLGHGGTDPKSDAGESKDSSSIARGKASDPRASATIQKGTTE